MEVLKGHTYHKAGDPLRCTYHPAGWRDRVGRGRMVLTLFDLEKRLAQWGETQAVLRRRPQAGDGVSMVFCAVPLVPGETVIRVTAI